MKAEKEKKLTIKERAFVDCYTGNGTEAARMAGYKGNDRTLAAIACQNLRKLHIKKAIEERNSGLKNYRIANRADRQEFWSNIMRDRRHELSNRLTASKLLGQSECDFVQRVEIIKSHEDWLKEIEDEDNATSETGKATVH